MINIDRTAEELVALFKIPLRYRLLATKVVIKGENRKEFLSLAARFLTENDPITEAEHILCEKIIISSWKLERARVIERNLLNKENEIRPSNNLEWTPDDDEDRRRRIRNIKKVRLSNPEIQYIIQYQFELEKGIQRALRRLREERSSRNTTQND